MIRHLILAALVALGLAAVAPNGATAAVVGPGLAHQNEAAPATVQKAQYFYRRRWGYRPYYRRRFYRRPYFYRRPFYRRPYYYRRPFYRRPYYYRRPFFRRRFFL